MRYLTYGVVQVKAKEVGLIMSYRNAGKERLISLRFRDPTRTDVQNPRKMWIMTLAEANELIDHLHKQLVEPRCVGLIALLTPEQKKKALEYRGPDC